MSDSILTNERLVVLGAAVALGVFLIFTELSPKSGTRAPAGFAEGRTVPVKITLVTADAYDLACAADVTVNGARCAFARDGSPAVSSAEGTNLLAPYMTSDNRTLLLISDLWAEPALASRLAEENPTGKARDSLKRFNATCDLAIEKKVDDFFVRWLPTAAWSPRASAWSGRVSSCKVD